MHKINGKAKSNFVTTLKIETRPTNSPDLINEHLCRSFEPLSSTDNYSFSDVIRLKGIAEDQEITFDQPELSNLNEPFNITELRFALGSLRDATGPDNMHYDKLKNLPIDAVYYLFTIKYRTRGSFLSNGVF